MFDRLELMENVLFCMVTYMHFQSNMRQSLNNPNLSLTLTEYK